MEKANKTNQDPKVIRQLIDACGVMILDPNIRAFLKDKDPNAFRQAANAYFAAGGTLDDVSDLGVQEIHAIMLDGCDQTIDHDYHQYDHNRRAGFCAWETTKALRAAGFYVWYHMGINRDRIVTNATLDEITAHQVAK